MTDGTPCPCYAGREIACPIHGPLGVSASQVDTRKHAQTGEVRQFETGATRDMDTTKPDYEGFLSPRVVVRYGEYMHKHRHQADGSLRDSDNWQKGIPLDAYMKSGWRHFMDWWLYHRDMEPRESIEDALCALIFNASGYLHELLKEPDG